MAFVAQPAPMTTMTNATIEHLAIVFELDEKICGMAMTSIPSSDSLGCYFIAPATVRARSDKGSTVFHLRIGVRGHGTGWPYRKARPARVTQTCNPDGRVRPLRAELILMD